MRSWWCGGLILLALAGCAEPQRAPLYSPASAAVRFGYAEQPVGPNAVRVSYVTPAVRVNSSSEIPAGRAERMQVAQDLALWRAAELALAAGYPAFSVSDRQSDAQVNNYSEPYDSWGGFGLWGGGRGGGVGVGTGLSLGAPGGWTDVSARASFVARFEPENRPDNYNAQFAIDQARARYGNVMVAGNYGSASIPAASSGGSSSQ